MVLERLRAIYEAAGPEERRSMTLARKILEGALALEMDDEDEEINETENAVETTANGEGENDAKN